MNLVGTELSFLNSLLSHVGNERDLCKLNYQSVSIIHSVNSKQNKTRQNSLKAYSSTFVDR